MRYNICIPGTTRPLSECDTLAQAQNMWARWQNKLPNSDVFAIDTATGEVVAMRGYMV